MKKNWLQFLLAGILGGGLGIAYYKSVFYATSTSVLIYKISQDNNTDIPLLAVCTLGMGLLTVALLHAYGKVAKCVGDCGYLFNKALSPLLLLWLLLWVPFEFYSMLPMIFIIGVSIYRLMLIWPGTDKWLAKLDSRYNLYIMVAIILLVTVYFALMQVKGLNTMALGYNDWGVYYDIALNSLQGKWFLCSDSGRSFMGEHFIPGTIILIMPFVWLSKGGFWTFFWFSACLLCCGSLFAYLWARKFKIPSGAALLLAVAVILYPSVSNMNYCTYCGFHDIYVILPFIYLFAWLYESKHFKWAFAVFLFTLTIKETVPIFWLGVSVLIFLDRRRGWAAAMFIISILYFLLVMKWVFPALNDGYAYDSRFSVLGGSMMEIALSPFYKPGVFFGQLFRPGTFYFMGVLLVPLSLLVLCRPLLLLPSLGIIFVVCIQDTALMQNIGSPYQTEFVAMSFIAAILAYRDVHNGKMFPWLKWLGCGLKPDPLKPGFRPAILAGILVMVGISYFMYGLTLVGKQNMRRVLFDINRDKEIKKISKMLPPESRVLATERIAQFLFLEHNVGLTISGLRPEFDWIVIDILDHYNFQFSEQLRMNLLRNKDYELVFNRDLGNGCWIMIFHKQPRTHEIPNILIKMDESEWKSKGMPLPSRIPDYEIRVEMLSVSKLKFYIRVVNKVKHDATIFFEVHGTSGMDNISRIFGDGISPAPLAEIGEVYSFEYNIPPEIGRIEKVLSNIKPR